MQACAECPSPPPRVPRAHAHTLHHAVRERACVRAHRQVLYQGEPLVDLLVAARAHHYLEFKLVDGR